MARRSRPVPRRPAIIASGRNIKLDDFAALKAYKSRFAQTGVWQEQAFYFNKAVGLLGFAHDYTRDSMSRVGLIPAMLADDPAERPIPIDDDDAPEGLDPDLAKEILSRLEPFPEFMGRTAQLLDISGEVHVALVEDPDDVDGERCRVLSVNEMFVRDKFRYVRETPGDNIGQALRIPRQPAPPSGDPDRPPVKVSDGGFFRIWQPDPEYAELPYSHMIRLLGESDTLLLLTQLLRGIARSRIAMNGRIIAIAEELMLASAAPGETEDAGDGEARTNPFVEDLMAAAAAAMTEPESAAAALPLFIIGSKEQIKDGIVSIDLDRPIDEMALKWRDELRNDIAIGVNLPREILLGIGETNHWNAEEIKNQAWKNHLEPRAMGITAAVTEAFFRPQLLANGVDPKIVRRACITYDPSWFIGTPDLASKADKAYEDLVISGEARRRAEGWSEDDAPDDAEVQRRIWEDQQRRATIRIQGETTTTIEGAPEGAPGEPFDETTPTEDVVSPVQKPAPESKAPEAVPGTPAKNTPPGKKQAAALTAAGTARRRRLARLGGRVEGLERDARARLLTDANATVARALERAGTRVMSAASRKHKTLAADWREIPLGEVCAAAGRAGIEMLGLRDDELLAGALGGLEVRYRSIVGRAQRAAGQAAADAAGRDFDADELDARTAGGRDLGWAVLAAGVTALLSQALYSPHPEAPPVGEFDADSLVPMGLIRSALAAAGGATVTVPPDTPTGPSPADLVRALGPPSVDEEGGVAAGPAMTTYFADSLGIAAVARTWEVGDPSRPFEPHQELEGITFSDWDDPRLANDESFPPGDFLFPGDHDGCQCSLSYDFTDVDAAEEAA